MPNLVDVASLRTLVESDLTDSALQLLLDDADAEIIRRLGPLASQVEVLRSVGEQIMHLSRRASSVTSAVERVSVGWGNPQDYTLTMPGAALPALPDLKLHADGYRIERLVSGDNPSSVWRGVLTITYAPLDTAASRKRLEVDLVKLALSYDANTSTTTGDVRVQGVSDYQAEREKLFRSLATAGRRMIF